MSKKTTLVRTALTALLVSTAAATAAQAADYLSVNVGYYDALRKDQYATQYGAEYRFSDIGYGISPIVGGFGDDKGAAYGYGGFNWSVPLLPKQLYLVPNFAVGAYSNGDGKNLGL